MVEVRTESISSEELQERLHALEIGVSRLRTGDAQQLLTARSQLERDLLQLQERGRDVRADRSRLDSIDNALRSGAAWLVGRADRAGGLAHLREAANPPAEHWWWWLDGELAQHQRRLAVRIVLAVLGAVAVVVLIGVIASHLGGTPQEKEAATLASRGDILLIQGDYDQAQVAYEGSVQVLDTQPEIWAALAVLYERAGDADRADSALAKLSEQATSESSREVLLARSYERTDQLDMAMEHAEQAIALDSTSAEAYLERGSVFEGMQEFEAAMRDYEAASEYALSQKLDGVYVIARARLAVLLQAQAATQ